MLLKLTRFIVVGVTGLALTQAAWAEETVVSVNTDAMSANLGGQLRMEMTRADHGLDKTDDVTPDATESLGFTSAYLTLDGKIRKDVSFNLLLDALNAGTDGEFVEVGEFTWDATDMFAVSFGKSRVYQGGWEGYDYNSTMAHWQSLYAQYGYVFAPEAPALGLHLNMKGIGHAALQLVNDVVRDATMEGMYRYNKRAHMTWILHWCGEFGPIMPLFNFGSYDNNKSKYFDLGVKVNMPQVGLAANLDLSQNTTALKVPFGAKNYEIEAVTTNINLGASYTVKKTVRPAFFYSMYSVKQPEDKDLGIKDAKWNDTDATTGAKEWDDNGTVLGLSANVLAFGEGFEPFFALIQQSGKWQKPGEDKEEVKSEMYLKLGALAYF